jgi:dTDP-glucose 4,6-dehydratase
MAGEQIVIQGDGTPYRSYLYAADMAAWLWSVLIKGQTGRAYNVGAEESISILELAECICDLLNCRAGILTLQNIQAGLGASHYVPQTRCAHQELGLPAEMGLDEAIARTVRWHAESASKSVNTH